MRVYPTIKLENKLQRQGFDLIAGVDEVGRGSWAGPIVAAAVIFKPGIKITGVADSKMLSEKNRQILFEQIIDQCSYWSAAAIGPQIIDLINVGQANLLVMEKAVRKLTTAGFKVYCHEKIPPNDGGLALGQLYAANYIIG